MSIEIWDNLKKEQDKKRAEFFAIAEREKAELEKQKANLLKEYGGKKNDAPEYLRKQITNLENDYFDKYAVEGKYFTELLKKQEQDRLEHIKNDEKYDEAEKRKQLEKSRGIER